MIKVGALPWSEVWWRLLPKSGGGRFSFQHHWRGLDEEQAKSADESALYGTEHSIHGDLRMEAEGGNLWGVSVFLGSPGKARGRLEELKDGDALQCSPKPEEPHEWLTIADSSPHIIEPGGTGGTEEAWAKIFQEGAGDYKLGVCREHSFEIFFFGEKIKGRHLFTLVPVGEEQSWTLRKPEDQAPIAERAALDEEIEDVKSKEQRWLYWAKPGSRPVLYDATKAQPLKKTLSGAFVNNWIPAGAKILFVGASPNGADACRGVPFVGPAGETLLKQYLKPLGLSRADVALCNAVPLYLTHEDGQVREPTTEEIAEWRGELVAAITKAALPVIALGKTARDALGPLLFSEWMPHPYAVRAFGASGEVTRKIRKIKKALTSCNKANMRDNSIGIGNAPIVKADEEKQIAIGVVLEADTVDAQGDVVTAEEIERAAHEYMIKSRTIGFLHREKADAIPVESVVVPAGSRAWGIDFDHTSWVMAVYVPDKEIWGKVKRGEIQAFSIGGSGSRSPIANDKQS